MKIAVVRCSDVRSEKEKPEIEKLCGFLSENGAQPAVGDNLYVSADGRERAQELMRFFGGDDSAFQTGILSNGKKIYVDGELLNTIELRKTRNQGWQGNRLNPFKSDEEDFGLYLILNLALGRHGGTPDNARYPIHYYVDYVRVYQPVRVAYECRHIL